LEELLKNTINMFLGFFDIMGFLFSCLQHLFLIGFPLMMIPLGLGGIMHWTDEKENFIYLVYGIGQILMGLMVGVCAFYYYFIW